MDNMGTGRRGYEAVNVETREAIGTLMLGIIALVLLIALLRQMERNGQLLAKYGE